MTDTVFEGTKILDLTWSAVGPLSIKYLADNGATVIRVDSHSRPCLLSVARPFKGDFVHMDHGWWYAEYQCSKMSVSLDLSKPKGRDVVRRLITDWQPDIFAEGFTPGTVQKWELGYEHVRALKPDIIYFSTSMQGQTGPLANHPGYGTQLVATAGYTHISGWPDRMPAPPYGAYTDFINPKYASTHLIAALDYKRRTGKGMYLEQSQFECALQFFGPVVMDYAVNGRILCRDGNRSPSSAPHAVYPCQGRERWVAIDTSTEEQWHAFCRIAGHPEWASDSRFTSLELRKAHEDELDELVAGWTRTLVAEDVAIKLVGVGVPASVVESIKDLYEDEQLRHRRHFRYLDWSAFGPTAFGSFAFRLSKSPDDQKSPPIFGQHNEYVFREVLNMSDDEIGDLLAEHVITTTADFPFAK